ncbi:hypothetical protein B1756_07780 [Natrarchaeobaculum aegyptiacum]|uniref:DUF8125 domain-containing protein n=2 Tax=Natrarchaeobaculum aegyptiacum TaxID=745377 RepID=A0A2Z2HR74_9EURY|nr:hypothetical protein B1756_07780 [Natrarchaeobaculum aegyptiacum]
MWIVAIILGAASVALMLGFSPNVSTEVLLVALCLGWGLVAGYPVSGVVIDKIGDEPGVFVVDVAAETLEHDSGLYWMPYTEFVEYDVLDGSLDQVAPFLYFARNVDSEAMTMEGTWRGTLTDRELLAALSAVKECRGMLEEDARRAFALETNLWSVVYRASKHATKSVVRTFEEGLLPDEGEGVDRAVSDAMEQFDLERMADRLDDENADLEELVDAAGDDQDSAHADTEESLDEPLESPLPADD